MTYLWIAIAFWAGFVICWWSTAWLATKGFRRDGIMTEIFETMPHDTLLKWRAALEAELEKRRAQ